MKRLIIYINYVRSLFSYMYLCKNWYELVLIVLNKNVSNEDFFIKMRNGMKILIKKNYNDVIMFGEHFIHKVYIKNGITLKKGDIVLDMGANKGLFTLSVINIVGPGGKIYCYEPVKSNFDFLCKNCTEFKNIFPKNYGIYNKDSFLNIGIHETHLGSHSIMNRDGIDHFEKIELKDINSELKNFNNIDLLKIDIEGPEFLILSALSDENFFKIKQISMEVHPDLGGFSLIDLIDLLEKKGFYVIDNFLIDYSLLAIRKG